MTGQLYTYISTQQYTHTHTHTHTHRYNADCDKCYKGGMKTYAHKGVKNEFWMEKFTMSTNKNKMSYTSKDQWYSELF